MRLGYSSESRRMIPDKKKCVRYSSNLIFLWKAPSRGG